MSEDEEASTSHDPGKAPASTLVNDWPEGGDDDDCYILEVYDPIPISFTFPLDTPSSEPAAQVVEDVAPLAQQGIPK